jgi:hypothetical protein
MFTVVVFRRVSLYVSLVGGGLRLVSQGPHQGQMVVFVHIEEYQDTVSDTVILFRILDRVVFMVNTQVLYPTVLYYKPISLLWC